MTVMTTLLLTLANSTACAKAPTELVLTTTTAMKRTKDKWTNWLQSSQRQ
jgi:hypothetical protein